MEECSNFHQKNLTWSDCMLFYKLMEALRWGTKCDTTVTQLLLPKCLFWIELTLQTVDLQELTRKKFGRFKTSPVHASNFFALIFDSSPLNCLHIHQAAQCSWGTNCDTSVTQLRHNRTRHRKGDCEARKPSLEPQRRPLFPHEGTRFSAETHSKQRNPLLIAGNGLANCCKKN